MGQLAKYEFLTEDDLLKMREAPLNLHYKVENQNTGAAPYFREAIRTQVLATLKEINKDRPEDQQLNLYTSGLRIYTSIDSRMQKYAEESVRNICRQNKNYFIRIGKVEIRG